jgi:cyclopropane fatty-acyl-phospholipid synthase-like methyltransferase
MLKKLWFDYSYLKRPVWDTGISPQELLGFITSHPPGRALDIGCGTGTNAITLAKSGWSVIGIDFSRRAIQIARKKAHNNGVKINFILKDVIQLDDIPGCFDLILDMGCFHGLSTTDRLKYIAIIERFLTPGGTFLLYVFFKNHYDNHGPGVTEEDIFLLTQSLLLIDRTNSTERGIRPSAWLTYQKFK